MTSRAKNTFGIILVALGVIGLVLLFLISLPIILATILFLIVIGLFIIAALIIIGFLAVIPFYFLKYGKDSEPGKYRIEDVRPIKEDEKK